METLALSGSTIRGTVKGKLVNCSVKTSPVGLKLPPGRYVLRASAANPVYGTVLSIESLSSGDAGGAAAIATLLPPGVNHPSTPTAIKFAPPAAPSAQKVTPAGLKVAPGAHKIAPSTIKDAPAVKADFAPSMKFDSPSMKFDGPAAGRSGQRVLISSRSIGEDSFVAVSGFSDLLDAVQRAGEVTLVVG